MALSKLISKLSNPEKLLKSVVTAQIGFLGMHGTSLIYSVGQCLWCKYSNNS